MENGTFSFFSRGFQGKAKQKYKKKKGTKFIKSLYFNASLIVYMSTIL